MPSLHPSLVAFLVGVAATVIVGCSGSTESATTSSSTTSIVAPAATGDATECATARSIADVLSSADFSDRDGLEALPGDVRALADVVPADLTPDVETLASALDGFVALLGEYDFDLTRIDNDPAAQARLADMNDPAVTEATQRIQDWLDETCAGS